MSCFETTKKAEHLWVWLSFMLTSQLYLLWWTIDPNTLPPPPPSLSLSLFSTTSLSAFRALWFTLLPLVSLSLYSYSVLSLLACGLSLPCFLSLPCWLSLFLSLSLSLSLYLSLYLSISISLSALLRGSPCVSLVESVHQSVFFVCLMHITDKTNNLAF